MSAGSVTHDALHHVHTDMNRLTVAQLKQVIRGLGVPVTGTKGTLQDRLKKKLDEVYRSNDVAGLQKIRSLISSNARSSSQSTFTNFSPSSAQSGQFDRNMGPATAPGPVSFGSSHNSYSQIRLNFRDSPFYEVEKPLTRVEQTKAVDASRGSFELKIKLAPDVALRFAKENPSRDRTRLMIFCASEPVSSFVKLDVAFPNQVELRVNGTEVRSNLRGLKNRPGSTRPADITELIRKSPNYENALSATYALTNKKYYFVVNLVNYTPCEDLVRKLREGKSISKEQVIREMLGKAKDNDLEAVSTRMSLKCPLSTLRMDTPCRSAICNHNQCFDALSFLQLQLQGPTWTCPLCNRVIAFEGLHVDEYVNEILKATPHHIEQVTITPTGQWEIVDPNESKSRSNHNRESSGDDELIEIPDISNIGNVPTYSAPAISTSIQTPIQPSREQSVSSNIGRSSSGKRQHSAIIDLTLSDEDDEPARAPKRLALNAVPSSRPYDSCNASQNARQNTLSFSLPKASTGRPPSALDYGFSAR